MLQTEPLRGALRVTLLDYLK